MNQISGQFIAYVTQKCSYKTMPLRIFFKFYAGQRKILSKWSIQINLIDELKVLYIHRYFHLDEMRSSSSLVCPSHPSSLLGMQSQFGSLESIEQQSSLTAQCKIVKNLFLVTQFSLVNYIEMVCSVVQCSAVQCIAVWANTVHCSAAF